jgi:hypothetical protein
MGDLRHGRRIGYYPLIRRWCRNKEEPNRLPRHQEQRLLGGRMVPMGDQRQMLFDFQFDLA